MQVKKNTLLLLACLVWTAAGVNILRIGLLAYATQVSLPHILPVSYTHLTLPTTERV